MSVRYASPLGVYEGLDKPRGASLFDLRPKRSKSSVRKISSPVQRRLRYSNGDTYTGPMRDGVADGCGVLLHNDGSLYKGDFVKGYKEGTGCFIFKNGDKYVGSFSKDSITGSGTFLFADGGRYTGEFEDGLFHGEGSRIYGDGGYFHGTFERGHPVTGTWIMCDGQIMCQRET
mmetsp:Transcript_28425/g.69146  ORF Transcript_28425/g.69146 Transcript_28425/m.69146 type:complete len:174 (+) Transcript_28425:281-802(+)